jgi:hypothetical protein
MKGVIHKWQNDIQHNDIQQNNTQNNDTQDKGIKHNNIKSDSLHNGTTKCCADCQYGNVCLCCV